LANCFRAVAGRTLWIITLRVIITRFFQNDSRFAPSPRHRLPRDPVSRAGKG